jgi:hypothetical protein
MVVVKFMMRQRDHLVPTLVCAIQFTFGIACLMVSVSNFLVILFRQLLSLALVSLMICVTHFLLPIECKSVRALARATFSKVICASLHIAL